MRINTRNFGEIDIFDEKIIEFVDGIPGFDNIKKFVVLGENGETFYWLQSIDEPDVAFVIMNVFEYLSDHKPTVDDSLLECLGECDDEDLLVYNIAVIPEDIEKMSVNLKAPIVINIKTKKGKQIIVNDDNCPIKYYIYEELKKVGGKNASTN